MATTAAPVNNGTTSDPYYLTAFAKFHFIVEAPGAITIGVVFAVLLAILCSCCILSDAFSIRKHCRFACRNCRDCFKEGGAAGKKRGDRLKENLASLNCDEVFTVTGDKKALTASEA